MAVPRWDYTCSGCMNGDESKQPSASRRKSKLLKKFLFKKHPKTEDNSLVFAKETTSNDFDTSVVPRRRVRPSRSRIMSDPTSSRYEEFTSPELDERVMNKSASAVSVSTSGSVIDKGVNSSYTPIHCSKHASNHLAFSDDLVNTFSDKIDLESSRLHCCDDVPKFVSPPATVITAETNDVTCHCQACCRCCPGNSPARTCLHFQSDSDDLSYESLQNNSSYGDWKNPTCSPTSVHSWGHFSMRIDNRYKYRRSDYSSDSDDDGTFRNMSKRRSHSSVSGHMSHLPIQNLEVFGSSPFKNSDRKKVERSEGSSLKYEKSTKTFSEEGVTPAVFKTRMQEMSHWFSEFSQLQKNLVLKGFLKCCDLPQMHLLSVKMEKNLHRGCPINCEDIITWLPNQIAGRVMLYLDPVSLCRASQVCKVWKQMADEPSLWKRFCCHPKWRLSKAAEHKQVFSHMSPEGSIQWKKVLAERFRLRNNWIRGRCTVRTFEGHSQGISCVQFDDTRIVSGSSDKTIKVWNIRTNAQWSVQTLVGHSGTVRCLHLEGNRLVSGSTDKSIKVWDLSTQESWSSIACKVTMIGHIDTVRCLQVDDDKVISGSYDKTLKIWDLKSGDCRRTLRGHEAAVLCIHFNETKIVSGSCDKTIKVWSFDGACLMTLNGHQDAVTCLQFDSTRIVSGSLDCNLKFWDIQTGDCVNTIDWKAAEGHTGVVRFLQADSWRLVSAADDKTIKVWSLETGQRLVTLRNHTDGVTCLQFNDFIIVSGSYDKTVKLWDFSCC